jgi:hypothetical protein
MVLSHNSLTGTIPSTICADFQVCCPMHWFFWTFIVSVYFCLAGIRASNHKLQPSVSHSWQALFVHISCNICILSKLWMGPALGTMTTKNAGNTN